MISYLQFTIDSGLIKDKRICVSYSKRSQTNRINCKHSMGQQSLRIMIHKKTQPSCYNRTTQDYSNGQILALDSTRNLHETTVCFTSSDARQTVDELLSECLEIRLLCQSYDAMFQGVNSKKQQKERNSACRNSFQKSKIQFMKGDKSNECVKCKLWGADQEQRYQEKEKVVTTSKYCQFCP